VLRVINRELDAAFDVKTFEHHAFYDPELERIEMHLVSKTSQEVPIRTLDLTVEFDRGESILTEISRKFTATGLAQLFEQADMAVERHYEPENRFFSLVFARPT
jgi:L-histidine N-alpha-methyltransferase